MVEWQTRRLQVPVVAIPCGFKSHLLHYRALYLYMRKCWNWQTGKTKDLVLVLACGFKSHLPQEVESEEALKYQRFPYFLLKRLWYCRTSPTWMHVLAAPLLRTSISPETVSSIMNIWDTDWSVNFINAVTNLAGGTIWSGWKSVSLIILTSHYLSKHLMKSGKNLRIYWKAEVQWNYLILWMKMEYRQGKQ